MRFVHGITHIGQLISSLSCSAATNFFKWCMPYIITKLVIYSKYIYKALCINFALKELNQDVIFLMKLEMQGRDEQHMVNVLSLLNISCWPQMPSFI